MKVRSLFATISCSCLFLALTAGLAPAQEGKGREIIGGVLKAIMDARRGQDPGASAAGVPGSVDLNAFRVALASFRQELDVLSASAQRSGVQGIRALSPQIAQLQNRAKFTDAYLSRETRLELFLEHCAGLEQEWRPLSNQVLQVRGADLLVPTAATNLDAHLDHMWRSLGRFPQGAIQPPGAGGGSDLQILLDLLDREIENLYDQVSLRQLLSLPPQQTDKLFGQAVRLSEAGAFLDQEVTRGARRETLVGAHRAFQQEWNSFQAILRGEPSLRSGIACDRVDSYIAELGELLTGSGRFRILHGSQPAGAAALSQLAGLATRLEVLAGDLAGEIHRNGEHFRNDSLRDTLLTQSNGFLAKAQNFRRFLMRPAVDRGGQVDAHQLRRAWQEASASWPPLSASLDQLASKVRRSDRYFPDIFRSQDEVAALMVRIQADMR